MLGSFIGWWEAEYVKSCGLDAVEGSRSCKKFLAGLAADYPAGGRMRAGYFAHLKYGWPIAREGYAYCRIDFKLTARAACAYVLLSADGRPRYVSIAPTYDSRDGEYRPFLISCEDFAYAYEKGAEVFSKLEAELLRLIAAGQLELEASLFPRSAEASQIADLRLPLKCAVVAAAVAVGALATGRSADPHVLPAFSAGLLELKAASPRLAALCGEAWLEAIESLSILRAGRPPRNLKVCCGAKLVPLTLREVMAPGDVNFATWREQVVREAASDLVLNRICPSFAFSNQWTYLSCAGAAEAASLFENPHVRARYRLGLAAEASVQDLREARKKLIPDVLDGPVAGFDAHVYDSIEFARSFLLMSSEVLFASDEYVGLTAASVPGALAGSLFPPIELANTMLRPGAFAKLAWDYLYGADCMHRQLGAIQADLHSNNLTVYYCGATHAVKWVDGKPVRTPLAESPLAAYVAGPKGEADTYVFPFTGVTGCVIDFSRALLGPAGRILKQIGAERGAGFVTNFLRDQVTRIMRAFHRSIPSYTVKNQEAIKAAILVNPDAVFRVLSYLDFYSIGRSLGSVLDTKPAGAHPANFAPPPELREFARRIESASRDALITHLADVVASPKIEPTRIPCAGEALLPKLFAEYRFAKWDTAALKRGLLVDAYNWNNALEASGASYSTFPASSRLDRIEEHLGGAKITDLFLRGTGAFLESILPSPRIEVTAEKVRATQDSLDTPASDTSSWIGGSGPPAQAPRPCADAK